MSGKKRPLHDKDDLSTLKKVLDLLLVNVKENGKNSKKNSKDIYTYANFDIKKQGITRSVAKECVSLVNFCLLSNHYEEAAKLMWILVQDRNIFDAFLFKAIMILIENSQLSDKSDIVWKFHSDIQNTQLINIREVQLEYTICSLRNDMPDIQSKVQNLISRKSANKLRKDSNLDSIFNAYKTFPDYIEWCKSSIEGIAPSQAKTSADRAIMVFTDILDVSGVWDIFVLKLVEMLTYLEKQGEIENILVKYIQKNPDHINAYIYLCLFLMHYDPNSENLSTHLQKLAELCPSDERVLVLVEKWNEKGIKVKKSIKLIFMFLDYPTNGGNIQAWEMLSNLILLVESKKNVKLKGTLESCWKFRKQSWHWMYFNTSQSHVKNDINVERVMAKLKVISYFEPDHVYIETIKKFLNIP